MRRIPRYSVHLSFVDHTFIFVTYLVASEVEEKQEDEESEDEPVLTDAEEDSGADLDDEDDKGRL